jgi:hypothetical protein
VLEPPALTVDLAASAYLPIYSPSTHTGRNFARLLATVVDTFLM